MTTEPLVTIWVTSTGRACAVQCVQETVRQCKYPNYRMLIFESQPDNPHGTLDAFYALDCEKRIWVGDYPPLGFIYNLFADNSDRFIQRLDDDCWPACDPSDHWRDAIALLQAQPLNRPLSHVATEMNPRVCANPDVPAMKADPTLVGIVREGPFGPLALYRDPSGISLMDRQFMLPWNETCHWRQTELYHILLARQCRHLTAYMLRWWGCIGHFDALAVDGIDRTQQAAAYAMYRDNGYFGRRPPETLMTAFVGNSLPAAPRERRESDG